MANRYHLYNKQRGKNYAYIDRVCRNQIEMGGCLLNVYRWEGVKREDGTVIPIEECKVSDTILNENSGRTYSHTTIDIYGAMKMNTPTFSFSFSGYSVLDGDEKEIIFHYNAMIEQIGRKIIEGDVIEMTWYRNYDILGSNNCTNKFYVVTSTQIDDQGWDPNWGYHLWKVKCKPMPNSIEYSDLINKTVDENGNLIATGGEDGFYELPNAGEGGGGIDGSNTDEDTLNEQNDKNLADAEKDVAFREYDEHNLLLDQLEIRKDIAGNWVVHGLDGIPMDSNCEDIPFGEYFPDKSTVKNGDYFLRIDFDPPRLFRRFTDENGRSGWRLWEFDRRPKWFGVPDKLRKALNNEYTFTNEMGETQQVRQEMDQLVKARIHKEGDNADGSPAYMRPWTKSIAEEIGTDTIIGIKKP